MGRALRRTVGALLICVLIAAATGFYVYSPRLALTTWRGPASWAEPAPTAPPSTPGPARTPTPAPTSTVAATTQSPDPDLPPGPGGRQPGIRLVARLVGSGDFEVTETVRLAAPVTELVLAPPDLRLAGQSLRTARAVATDVVVRADGRSVRLPRTTVRRATTIRLAIATERFAIRYRLRGTIRVSQPSRAGRALGAVGPLVSNVSGHLPVTVALPGAAVRNVSCPCLPVDEQSCIAGRRPNLRVNRPLERKAALVVVQLDLQASGAAGSR